jgi:hypothetical protein
MDPMYKLASFLLALPLGSPADLQAQLTQENLADLLERILPAEEELEWGDIGWRPSLADAIVEAREADQPILLWAMNGHPLGCV